MDIMDSVAVVGMPNIDSSNRTAVVATRINFSDHTNVVNP